MLNVTITKGISGSGKTTWAKEQVKANPGSTVIVCKDDIRNMLWDGGYSKGREYLVKLCRNNLICAALSDGKHVISADTNFGTNEQEVRDVVADWAKANNAQVQIHVQDFTEVPLIVCITQDAQRAKPLGESVIREQYRRWICKDPVVLEQDQSLPLSIIVDLDGTLCHMHNRSPFEWHKVGEDYVDEIVAQIVKDYYSLGYEILLVSGRDGVCRAQTRSWLESNNIPFHALFMREENDNRKDSVIKEEIFFREIFGKWNVKFVLDDRDQIVRTWRNIGLKCLQVAEGNF